jgi:hypothetical protein
VASDTSSDEYDTAQQQLSGHPAAPTGTAVEALALVHTVLAASTAPTGPAAPLEPTHLLAALTVLRHLREELASWEPQLITAARQQGVSWVTLAPALGVTSRQAAERRYLRLRPAVTGEHTGEARVRAERDKRASDRAVAAWARQNSGSLRQLAGQISALEGLTAPAQRRVDIVQQALAGNDAATLLSPLADTQTHLEASHAGLAEQIKAVTEHTDQLRRDTHDHRSATT